MRLKSLLAIIGMVLFVSCGTRTDKEYLTEVLQNMNKVESVTYHCVSQAWEPGDKNPVYTDPVEVYEHNNLQDKEVGSSFLVSNDTDFKNLKYGYDGEVKFNLNTEEKEVLINDFSRKNILSFRLVMPEFFYYTKAVLDYALTTTDSISLLLKDQEKDYLMELTINMPMQVEFFGKPCYMPKNPYIKDPVSVYKIWISKKNNLPYRIRREMEHSISEKTCSNFVLNPSDKGRIVAENYYPEDYTLHKIGEDRRKRLVDMTGKKAPEWKLSDINDKSVTLQDLKSKVILLQLTGIGCGPCGASTPFLHQLREKYSKEELEIVAVETWGRQKSSCEAYIKKHDINYRFLTADKETVAELIKDYQAGSGVPQFYIIDKDRIIQKKLKGYTVKNSDKEIEDEIKRLL